MSQINVNTIANASGTSSMTVDANGVVTRNTLPAWMIQLTADQVFTVQDTWSTITNMSHTATNSFIQGGITHSSGVITVPVAGVYQVSFATRVDEVSTGYLWTMISINDSNDTTSQYSHLDNEPASAYTTPVCSGIYNLSANDTLRCKIYTSADTNYHPAQQTFFSGFLVG